MAVNLDKPGIWKEDIDDSVRLYNDWFMHFAPKAFRETRVVTAQRVEYALQKTDYLIHMEPALLEKEPGLLPILRMTTCPPIARDRLIGLAGVSKNLVESMENVERCRIPPRMPIKVLHDDLEKICRIIREMADPDIFVWLVRGVRPTELEKSRAATIVADRLCGAIADPIIRNAQEKRQLSAIGQWLEEAGYRRAGADVKYNRMKPGTYAFRMNIPAKMANATDRTATVNIPINVLIMPQRAKEGELPLLVETKSAGDFTNVNKRRKEEAQKMGQLKATYGDAARFVLFLCGYFDSGYLGYEAAEGIDWIWEHRMDDFRQFGL